MKVLRFAAILTIFAMGGTAFASDLQLPGFQLAQFEADDTYDPFADYSEFDEAQDEEADINFFRNGRFVTVGFMGGFRGFTEGLGGMYRPATRFGLFLSYFFDLRFALQFSFLTSDHTFRVVGSNPDQVARGNVSITTFGLDIKYYVNTQNVTKGLAKFNPYFIAGFARVDRTTSLQDPGGDVLPGFGREGAMGFDFGIGIELPMLRNKMYFGGQAMYQLVNFQNENTEIRFNSGEQTNKYPNGDIWTALGIIGVNF